MPKNLIISKLDLLGNVLNINSIIKINYPELLTIIKTTMKNLTISFCFILLLAFSYNSPAQSKGLYIPLNIKKSFDAGIRSIDGNPGKNYWQNYSDYKIKAELLPDSSTLIGSEEITYHNASPDTLDHLVIRLYQDILKKGGVREFDIGNTELTNGVDVKLLIVDGDTLDVTSGDSGVRRSGTNMRVRLKKALAPNSEIHLKIDWSFYIPKIVKIRMGNYGEGEFFIAYWYPQISVYDDIDGWDNIDYSGQVEFYNDFSNYEFDITLPGNYVVWATGELQNSEDVFQKNVLDKITKAKISDEKVNIISANDFREKQVTNNNKTNIWKFRANDVSDVSFCVSDSYVWDAASVQVHNSGRRVLTNAVYEESTTNYENGAIFSRMTIDYLSHELPGYPYPYPHITSFCNKSGGGGMETPMMANDGAPKEAAKTLGLIFHEITHTLFPFYMGVNERKYAWMDEGWASFYLTEIVDNYPGGKGYKAHEVSGYENAAGNEMELPLITPSFSYKGQYSRIGFYNKPATAYYELKDLLGRDLFKKAINSYMERWHGKHPLPLDFFNTFNNVAGEDLSWFWNPWFYEYGFPDLALKNVSQKGNDVNITIEKVGNLPTKIELTLIYTDGTKEEINKSIKEWKNNNLVEIKLNTSKKLKEVSLGSPEIPDVNRNNNIINM